MDRQYVGIDFHRRRSVIVVKDAAGEKLSSVRVANDPLTIVSAVAQAGPDPEVVIEATYGWYWVVDLLQAEGANVHLANPSGLNWGTRRVKNDERDAVDLIDMLRLGRLPEASRHRRRASCGSGCGTGRSWWRCGRASRPRCTR